MAVFTELTHAQASQMLENYDLGTLLNLTPIQSGTENTNYFIEMQDQQTTEYLLTIFERLEAIDLPFYLNFTAYLAEKGVLVPKPLELATQPNLMFNSGNCKYLNQGIPSLKIAKPWAVVEKLAGQNVMQPHAIHIAQVAQNLAKLHQISENYHPRQKNMRGMAWWHRTIPLIYPYLDMRKANLLASEFEVQQSFYQSELYQRLPKSIAHCDLFRDNVMFKSCDISTAEGKNAFQNFESYYKDLDLSKPIQLSGFFDFYFAAYETMLFDICITINDWCMDLFGQLDTVLRDIFLTEYQKIRKLTDAENEAIPLMFRAASLRFWVSRLYDWHMPRGASLFKPHPPEHFEMILRYHRNTR